MQQTWYANRTLWGSAATGVQVGGQLKAWIAWFAVSPKINGAGKVEGQVKQQGYLALANIDPGKRFHIRVELQQLRRFQHRAQDRIERRAGGFRHMNEQQRTSVVLERRIDGLVCARPIDSAGGDIAERGALAWRRALRRLGACVWPQ
jgi:hypothetical protein